MIWARRSSVDQDEKIYRELQRHLNRQAVGFPATRSGADIKLLKHIFSPRDAEMATCLNPIVAKAGGLQSQGAEGAAVVNLLQALGNAGSGVLRLSP
jgi:hypothetical protein